MKFFMLVPQYISWHYTQGLALWIHNMLAFIMFEFEFFSVKELFLTLFAPFQKLKEKNTGSIVDIENILSILIVNITMRFVGLFVRTTILIVALVCITISLLTMLVSVVLWLLLPLLLLFITLGALVSFLKYKP